METPMIAWIYTSKQVLNILCTGIIQFRFILLLHLRLIFLHNLNSISRYRSKGAGHAQGQIVHTIIILKLINLIIHIKFYESNCVYSDTLFSILNNMKEYQIQEILKVSPYLHMKCLLLIPLDVGEVGPVATQKQHKT